MPSMYSLHGYFLVTVVSFWLPTLVSLICIWMWKRTRNVPNTWVINGAQIVVAASVVLQVAGWGFDAIWMHKLSQLVGLVGFTVFGIWAMAYIVGIVKPK